MKEQILAKLKEEKLVEKLFACESIEQVQELFKDSGVEITKEEAQEVIDGMVMLSQKMLSLSEEELEACSGGSKVGEITGNISQEITNGFTATNNFIQNNSELVGGMAIGGAAVAGTILAGVGVYKVGKYVYNAVKNNSGKILEAIMLTSVGISVAPTRAIMKFYGKR